MKNCIYLLLASLLLLPAALQAQSPKPHFVPQIAEHGKPYTREQSFSSTIASSRTLWSTTKSTFEQGDAIGVIASTYTSSQTSYDVPYGNMLNNAKLVRYASGWYLEDGLAIWQTGDIMTAYAYWPYDAAIVLSQGTSAATPAISFQPAKNIRDQQDLLYASATYITDLSKPVSLMFKHILAQIKFKANKANGMTEKVVITRLRLLNLSVVAGKFDTGAIIAKAWIGTKSYSDLYPKETIDGSPYYVCADSGELIPVELTESTYGITTDEPLGDPTTLQYVLGGGSEHGFLVIPQTISTNQAVAIDYTIDDVAQPTIVRKFLKEGTWTVQNTMVINFHISNPNA